MYSTKKEMHEQRINLFTLHCLIILTHIIEQLMCVKVFAKACPRIHSLRIFKLWRILTNIPPANSVAILINNGNLVVFDSHQHGSQGGLVLVGKLREIDELFNYLREKHNLCGSNFAELAMVV